MHPQLINTLDKSRILIADKLSGKKRALEQISQLIAEGLTDISFKKIFHAFIEREKIGSTAIGHGIAIPHIRLNELKHSRAAFIRLNSPINFSDTEQQPVDLIFALAVSDKNMQEHLNLLAMISERFHEKDFRKAIRQAKDSQHILDIFSSE